jgi:predicted RNA-binding Zn-ribbon protein involved in translation (DUF1610 family)
MIIWGTRGRQIEISSGQFNCPKCDAKRAYKRKRTARYFTLFFIPLFQIQNLGEYVECAFCHQTYKPEVLSYKPQSPTERAVLAIQRELKSGTPLHMVHQKLLNNGVDQQTAIKVIEAITSGSRVKCSKCGFTYLSGVKLCANCGTTLTA